MAAAGVAAGVDGVFMEVHEKPPQAKSDAQNALKLDLLPRLLDKLVRIHEVRLTLGSAGGVRLQADDDARLKPDSTKARQ
jgi:3-deoxy-D-manno-octulosonic acid (KDO) 8-phosphate synthase